MENNDTNPNTTHPEVRTDAIRAAIYARCASGAPEHSNAAEQIRTCKEYAEKQGWKVATEFVQTDVSASGVSLTGRTCLMYLLEAAQKSLRPFDCVLVADISQLGHSLERLTKLVSTFHGLGIFVQTVRGEFDSRNFHPGAWAASHFLNCIPQYSTLTARQCPMCGR